MIPAANDIVNSLLVREGVDDPERYVSWLKKQASARTLRDTGFGAAISTSDDDMIQLNARELGIDIENPVTIKDTLERDLAIIEANGMAILRRMGLFLQDEGHGVDGDRITSAWISVDNEDQARDLAAKVLSLARDQNNDPARTGSGTLNNLMPEAERLIWQNVSELGQRLIDVAIYFFDTEKLAEWASMAHVEESAEETVSQPPPEDDPESVLKTHQHSLLVPEMKRLGFKVGKDKSTVRFFDEEVPRFMVKGYTAADGSKRAIYVYIIHVLSGGNEFKVNNLDAANNCWFRHDTASDINVNCETTAKSAAAVRDLDAAMQRSAEMSLSVEEEHAMLQRVATHYSKWYWDSMQPVLNVNPPQG